MSCNNLHICIFAHLHMLIAAYLHINPIFACQNDFKIALAQLLSLVHHI
jgi:hypothetical protein